MKQSHIRTPRTLSDGSFSVGYPVAYRRGYGRGYWICFAIVSAVGLAIAWGTR